MDCATATTARLTAQGWRRRLTAAGPRLDEAVAEYRLLGFEVRLEPVDPAASDDGQCAACLGDPRAAEALRVIFTRRPQPKD
ncbi:conserved hypothetical protein [Desulfarculus baarsii DSM 2075]|uniref:Uncharacterized protein n=1 Tax=Desulfarculus baarsii (strain ATCC 33931 / DSM 2075 / LMG 7858 / VKM B-1802 / 2st14) TaxID=644282 RepID=E1QMB2_DESB2|nr:hypothetical protein [Desulfarculus baarsii]ADK86155.1 conserved hypothetical protein [Desulfarculus baarsii DSM 2075]